MGNESVTTEYEFEFDEEHPFSHYVEGSKFHHTNANHIIYAFTDARTD